MTAAKYHVGQALLRRDVNEGRLGGPQNVVVTKVGRTLVHVATRSDHPRPEAFRIEDGQANDRWGHGYIQTPEEYEDELAREALVHWLRTLGVEFRLGSPTYSLAALRQVANLLEGDAS